MRYILIPIFIFFASVNIIAQTTNNQEATAQAQQPTYVLKDIVVDGVKK